MVIGFYKPYKNELTDDIVMLAYWCSHWITQIYAHKYIYI